MKITFRPLLFDIVKIVKNNMIAGIKKQIGVDDSRFALLKPSTVQRKIMTGSATPNMRMIDTGDFLDNAYQHRIINDYSAEISLSKNTHSNSKTSYNDIGIYNQSNKSMHFGISQDTSNKIDTALKRYIDKTVDEVYDGV